MSQTIGSLPPITKTPAAQLLEMIITAYRDAVAAVNNMQPDEQKKARNRLFWGSRIGSKVEGVRDQTSVEQLFRRITSAGTIVPMRADADGNNVYCFALTSHYAGKGKTTYVRISDVIEKGSLFTAAVSFGVDYDEGKDRECVRPQAPNIRSLNSNIVTIVLSGDNTTFIEWFCGEPKKVYTKENVHELIDANGELNFDRMWIQLNVDYNARTMEKKRRLLSERARRKHEDHENRGNRHDEKPGLNAVSVVLETAQQEAEAEPVAAEAPEHPPTS